MHRYTIFVNGINRVLYKEIRPSTWRLAEVASLMLLVVAFDIIAPWPFKILIDNVLGSTPIEQDTLLYSIHQLFPTRDLLGFFSVFIYFSSTFAFNIAEYVRNIATKKVVQDLTSRFSKDAFKHLQSIAIGFYNDQKIGDYIYRLSYDVSALGMLVEDGLLPLATSSLYLIATLVVMFLINARLTLLSLVALPFLAAGLYTFNTYITKATKSSELRNSIAFSFIEEALKHLKIIQAFSQENMENKLFGRKIDASLSGEQNLNGLDFLLTLIVGIIIAISYSVIIIYGIKLVFLNQLTTGLLIVFIFYLDNLTNPILAIIYASSSTHESYEKLRRMEDLFGHTASGSRHHGTMRKITDPTLRFKNVTVTGHKNFKMLDNASFEIKAGATTVIFGVNGSGKTSVVNVLLRFIDKHVSGEITIGGVDIKKYDLATVRDAIAYVPQEISLFNDTIRHNIVFGNPHARPADIARVAHLSTADEFIKKLPDRYNFQVGEGGNKLSGGQRQRLMLARALLKKNASILLFDETFSALDVRTRTRVLNNLESFRKGKTTIIISNVFDVARHADNVIVLNKGKVLHAGPIFKLSRESTLYSMMEAHT